jgi:KDO2-lipid IV(A) lauroyltransferase
MIGCYMAQLGYPVNVVARAIYDERLNRLLLKYREEASVRVVLRDSPAAGRMILQALKKREILGMLIDQDTKVKGVMAEFFGRRANTPSGPAILAVRRSIPVVAGFIHRASDGKHHIIIYPEVEISRTGEFEKDVESTTQRFNQLIEREIRSYPCQWVWVHRRWRRKVAYDPSEEWKVHLTH